MATLVYVARVEGQCDSPFEDTTGPNDACECRPGMSGLGCYMCESDESCSNVQNGTFCNEGLVFAEDTPVKTYSCELASTFASFFPDGTVAFQCNQTSTECTLAVFKTVDTWRGEHAIDCTATACEFKEDSPDFDCANLDCKCGAECSSLTTTIVEQNLSGKRAMIRTSGNELTVNIDGSSLSVVAICSASGCSDVDADTDTIVNPGAGTQDPAESTAVESGTLLICLIIAIMTGVLTLIVIFCSAGGAMVRRKKSLLTEPLVDSLPGRVLAFTNLSCHATIKSKDGKTNENLTVLHKVSGTIQRGQVLGLLGPSGSGKTSLLNVLSGTRNGKSRVSGHVMMDGLPRSRQFRKIAAYVHQDDSLYPTLTVRECIEYSALLRLPKRLSTEEKQTRIDKVLEELDLVHVEHSRIGGNGIRGVSGGERRRVSIGMELVTAPQILFMDEPTSGLDSTSANRLVQLARKLARNGRIVIMSIHQPSAKSFLALDQVLLLAKGHVMYFGPSAIADASFAQSGYECPKNENIADFMLDVVADAENVAQLLKNATERSKTKAFESPTPVLGDDTSVNGFKSEDEPHNAQSDEYSRSILNEIQILYQRTARNTFRNRSLFLMHLFISVTVGVCGGLIFQGVTSDLAGFQNRTGAFYFVLTFFAFASFSSIDVFIAERRIFVREAGANYYGAFSYFLTKSTFDAITLRIIPVSLFSCIFYWIMGLQATASHFFVFLSTLILFNVAAGSIGACISIMMSSVGAANLIATVVFLVMLLFGGFLVNADTLAASIAWLEYVSIFSYAFEILMTNELKGLTMVFNAPGYPSIPVQGDVFLKTLGMDFEDQVMDLIALIVIIVVFNALALLLLYIRTPRAAKTSTSRSSVASTAAASGSDEQTLVEIASL